MNREDDNTNIPSVDVDEFQGLVEALYQCCQDRMQRQSERFGLPDAELRCLLLFRFDRYLTAKAIARRLGVAKSRVTKIVTSLIGKGFVERVDDPSDSRVKLLSLSRTGEELMREVVDFRFDTHSTVLKSFTDEQRGMLLNSLAMLKRYMKTSTEMME